MKTLTTVVNVDSDNVNVPCKNVNVVVEVTVEENEYGYADVVNLTVLSASAIPYRFKDGMTKLDISAKLDDVHTVGSALAVAARQELELTEYDDVTD